VRIGSLIAAASVLFGCTACGFKGPLYLPQQNAAVVTHPSTRRALTPAQATSAPHHNAQKKPNGGSGPPP
jgi:predicted small lipoprotein YifL